MKSFGFLMSCFLLCAGLGFGGAAFAQIDYSKYDLTSADIALCKRLEAKGIPESTIVDYIQHLIAYRHRPGVYIPPHTTELLNELNHWGAGAAYDAFALAAGVKFDKETYLADCPDRAAFNFGMATGTQYFNVDVAIEYINTFYALNQLHYKSPSTFREAYLRMIKDAGFDRYLIGE